MDYLNTMDTLSSKLHQFTIVTIDILILSIYLCISGKFQLMKINAFVNF